MPVKKYFEEVNIIRGIAVILVVIGHSFPDLHDGMGRIPAIIILQFCYSFHMAIFFAISGFLFVKPNSWNSFHEFIKKKIFRLLVPYFLFSIISIILKVVMNRYADNPFYVKDIWKIFIGESANTSLWFLWTLFVIYVIEFVFWRIFKSYRIILLISIMTYVLQIFLPLFFFTYVLRFQFFFVLGMLIRKNYDNTREKLQFSGIVNALLAILLVASSAIRTFTPIEDELYIISGTIGVFLIWSLSLRISSQETGLKKYFDEAGFYSYDIYLIGYYPQMIFRTIFDRILHVNYWFTCVLMFIGGYTIARMISKYIIRKSRVLSKVLLGV